MRMLMNNLDPEVAEHPDQLIVYGGSGRAARPVPPYTTRSAGRSATSGSRLFISIRIAASWIQPLQEMEEPRGARTDRGPATVFMAGEGTSKRGGDEVTEVMM